MKYRFIEPQWCDGLYFSTFQAKGNEALKSEVRGQLNVNDDIITPQDESLILDDPEDIYHVGVKKSKVSSTVHANLTLYFIKTLRQQGVNA